MTDSNSLQIRGLSENNLKSIDLEIPHDKFVVITGLSGSGKSSLAFDTVYAEGQRRYIETFSTYVRQFLDKIKQPNLTFIRKVRPAIAIEQHTRITNSRATVGSLSDVSDYLRLLFANLAELSCPQCGIDVKLLSPANITDQIAAKLSRSKDQNFLLIAPIITTGKDLQGNVERLQALGFSRIFNGSEVTRIEQVKDLQTISFSRLDGRSEILVVIDRVQTDHSPEQLGESIKQALNIGEGRLLLVDWKADKKHLCLVRQNSENFRGITKPFVEFELRPNCTAINDIPRPTPSLFSHNHPSGACPDCKGFGNVLLPDPRKIVPNEGHSIESGAIQCWTGSSGIAEKHKLHLFCKENGISLHLPWIKLSKDVQQKILYTKTKDYVGPIPWLKNLERKIYKMHVRIFLSKFRSETTCGACNGGKLRKDALGYHISGKTIADLLNLSLADLARWVTALHTTRAAQGNLSRELNEIFVTLTARLRYLNDLQLSYLTLNRQARTLSGGEVQRVRLATALGSELVSTQFVLDEPSIGLHPRDTEKLIEAISGLAAKGNSVLVVEHDEECIKRADHVIALGPGAGKLGGEVVFNGPGKNFPMPKVPELTKHPRLPLNRQLKISGACARNLKNISFNVPLNRITCLTGVSGSGKSTIVHEVIKPAWDRYLMGFPAQAINEQNLVVGEVDGFQQLQSFEVIDQSALAKSPRANIATYTGLWDRIRILFSLTPEAARQRLTASSFSFNTKGGRCPACEGAGRIKEEMQFLSDVFLPCEICAGKRFASKVLSVKLNQLNAAEVLALTIDELPKYLPNEMSLNTTCQVLSKLGLGHLTVGHSLSDLSGGEAQRLKLVPYITRSQIARSKNGALLVFDEPTTGLHALDIRRLLSVFEELIDQNHTVLCIEHNLSVVRHADHVIDIGPEGGAGGGQIIFSGTPEELLKVTGSYTGRYLAARAPKSNSTSTQSVTNCTEQLVIKGAREHNLKNIDVQVPLNEFVAITGVSGSGKSSLAKDIIFAEGQRRYLDCLSPYARQFIQELSKPDLDEITGVMPTVYVGQHMNQPSRYSTVGTLSEVYNFLRLLFSKVGIQYCHDHPEQRISTQDPEEIGETLKREFSGKRIRVLVRLVNQRKGSHVELFEKALMDEILEARVDGVFAPTSSFIEGLSKSKVHTIDLVLSHFNPANFSANDLKEIAGHALQKGDGSLIVVADGQDHTFSIDRACSICKRGYFKADPEDFSFSSSRGRCAECNGLGVTEELEICPDCHGERLGPIGRNVRIREKTISQVSTLSVIELRDFVTSLSFSRRQAELISEVQREILARLNTLSALGLGHLGMNQLCSNLSSGELNRLRLAAALGSPLSGVMYVLDEPSAGLHPDDNRLVLDKIKNIVDNNNSILMIEHDEESILAANHVIEVGPGGGRNGGRITYNGTAKKYRLPDGGANLLSESIARSAHGTMHVKCRSYNNLKKIDLKIPLNQLVAFGGVSGAGKSSLVYGVIGAALADSPRTATLIKQQNSEIKLSEPIKNLVIIDHKPIGKNSRSTPVSYLEIWDPIRKVFANSLEAKSKGHGQNFFSFNTGTGRCPNCLGSGTIDLEMGFLAEARVTCEACGGSRFGDEAKSIRYKGLNISQILALTFEEARAVFANHRKIHQPIHLACELGLGYLTLGQSSTTLSGGEAQRIKLVAELANERKDSSLYLLDEPTTGLHRSDVLRLVKALRSLVDKGHSVFVIEHDPALLNAADHIIEIGPGPGSHGGEVIFSGDIAALRSAKTPWGKILSSAEPSTLPKSTLKSKRRHTDRAA